MSRREALPRLVSCLLSRPSDSPVAAHENYYKGRVNSSVLCPLAGDAIGRIPPLPACSYCRKLTPFYMLVVKIPKFENISQLRVTTGSASCVGIGGQDTQFREHLPAESHNE
eukprot:6192593-Pleurochrysis_carterae.AAC.1